MPGSSLKIKKKLVMISYTLYVVRIFPFNLFLTPSFFLKRAFIKRAVADQDPSAGGANMLYISLLYKYRYYNQGHSYKSIDGKWRLAPWVNQTKVHILKTISFKKNSGAANKVARITPNLNKIHSIQSKIFEL